MNKKFIAAAILAGFAIAPQVNAESALANSFDYYETDSDETFEHPSIYNRYLRPIVGAVDYHTRNIYLINYKNDKLVTLNPSTIPGWPADVPLQHTMVMPNGKTVYVTTDNTEEHPAYIVALRVNSVNWNHGYADVVVDSALPVDVPNTAAALPFVEEVNNVQGVPAWIIAPSTQVHGPTILPYSKYVYFTDWTSDTVRVINRKTNQYAPIDPIVIEGYTEQTHGVMFNPSGTIGLGTGYFYDDSFIDLYKTNRRTGELEPVKKIRLGTEESYAAFSHYISWIDERYAVTATMQLDKTSLTPSGTDEIIPPSVWMIDAWEGTATKIIDATDNPDGHGVYLSASDIAVVGNKLYLAEEDSIDTSVFQEGYVSVFDITDRENPTFIKRFRPGVELPEGFAVAHTLSTTPDNRYIYMASWVSGYVVKIDTFTDTVAHIHGPEDGMVMPHGIHVGGGLR